MNTARINDAVPYGRNVHAIALDLLVDRKAANLVQHEVFCRAIGQTHNFSAADTWSGNSQWEGLQDLTIAVTLDILRLPAEENPLSRPLIGGVQLINEVNSRWWGILALTFRLRGLFEFQVGCLAVLKKSIPEIAEFLSKTETEIESSYQTAITEINAAIHQWAQTEIAAAHARIAEIEDLRKSYDYGRGV